MEKNQLPDSTEKKLKRDYRRYLRGIVDELQAEAIWKTPQQLRDICHKLAGSAGSYGFPGISKLAREVERKLQGDCESRTSLQKTVEKLRRTISEKLEEPN
jgi:HPt (histidine-containing phosphotransfer) domain-containing protein